MSFNPFERDAIYDSSVSDNAINQRWSNSNVFSNSSILTAPSLTNFNSPFVKTPPSYEEGTYFGFNPIDNINNSVSSGGPPPYDNFSSNSNISSKIDGETSFSNFDLPTIAVASLVNDVQKDFSQSINSNRSIQASLGNGPNGHSFMAIQDANLQNNLSNTFSDVKTAEILGGSLFGPYGLAAGVGAATATSLIQNFSSPNEENVQSTSGQEVNPSGLL